MDLLVSVKDRINRGSFWVAGLLLMLTWSVPWVVVASAVYRINSMPFVLLGAAVSFIFVAMSGSAIVIKRLHDRDRSGR